MSTQTMEQLLYEGEIIFASFEDIERPRDWMALHSWENRVMELIDNPDHEHLFLNTNPPAAPPHDRTYTGPRRVLWHRLVMLHRIVGA